MQNTLLIVEIGAVGSVAVVATTLGLILLGREIGWQALLAIMGLSATTIGAGVGIAFLAAPMLHLQ